MLHLLLLAWIGGFYILAMVVVMMVTVGGWRVSELRQLVLNDAYRSFTFDGDLIAGARPSLFARATIRLLSNRDDPRLETLALATARGAEGRSSVTRVRSRGDWSVFPTWNAMASGDADRKRQARAQSE
jgi:hypothetical protein